MAIATSKRSKFSDRLKKLKRKRTAAPARSSDDGDRGDLSSYWQAQLGGVRRLELPTDRPRTSRAAPRYRAAEGSVSGEVAGRLQELGRAEGTSLFGVLLGAFEVLLMRYAGQTDIVVGSPGPGRDRAETNGTGELFTDLLLLRTDLSGNPEFVELLGRVRRTVDGALEHRGLSVAALLDLARERWGEQEELHQVAFAVETGSPRGSDADGLAHEELAASVRSQGGGLSWRFRFDQGLFEQSTAERLSLHFGRLLREVACAPRRRLFELEMLTAAERVQETTEHARPVTEPQDPDIVTRFEAQVDRRPGATAVQCEGERLSYLELDRRANQVARFLLTLGVGAGSLVGVRLERSLEVVEVLLGILKTGGAFLPLGPELSAELTVGALDDARPSVLVTRERLARDLRVDRSLELVFLDRVREQIDALPTDRLVRAINGSGAACVFYSARAPEAPAGIPVHHAGLVGLGQSLRDRPGLEPDDVFVALSALSSDVSAVELLVPIMSGACVVVASEAVAASPRRVVRLLEGCQATVAVMPPSRWQELKTAGWTGSERMKILCGGEVLSAEVASALLTRGQSVWFMYGHPEAAIWSSIQEVSGADGEPPSSLLGAPIANTRMVVLGDDLELLPPGAEGELCVGGGGIARGYLGRPDATAARFVPDPYDDAGGARMFRTGDLARRRPDGALELLGRICGRTRVREPRAGWHRDTLGTRSAWGDAERKRKQTAGGDLLARAIAHYNELLINRYASSTMAHQRRMTELHNMRYGGTPFCNVLRPLMIDERTYSAHGHAATIVVQALERATEILLADQALLREMGIPEYLDSALDIDRTHSSFSHVTRLDALPVRDGGLMFIENNAGPGSLPWTYEVDRMFGGLPISREFARRFPFRSVPVYDHMFDAWLLHHRRRGGAGAPTIGLLTSNRRMHQDAYHRWLPYLSARGIRVLVGEAGDFEYRTGGLTVGDDRVDFLILQDDGPFLVAAAEVAHISRALKRGEVACWTNFSRDTVVSYKNLFEFLNNPEYHGHFSAETVKILKAYIPWTRVLRERKTTIDDEEIDLLPYVADNRHRFVLKPGGRYGGTDVILGWKCDAGEWQAAMSRALACSSVVQERVDMETEEYPVDSNGSVTFGSFYSDFDPHVWNAERADGLLVRVSPGEVTNIHAGAGVAGVWILEDAWR